MSTPFPQSQLLAPENLLKFHHQTNAVISYYIRTYVNKSLLTSLQVSSHNSSINSTFSVSSELSKSVLIMVFYKVDINATKYHIEGNF